MLRGERSPEGTRPRRQNTRNWTRQGVRYSLEDQETPLVPTTRGDQRSRRCSMALAPTPPALTNRLGGPPLSQLSPEIAHQVLTDLQSQPIELQDAQIEDAVWPVGPTGETRIRIIRPASAGSTARLPVILYTHGGGWVLGDKITHDRLVREIANGVGATVIFVDYVNAPEATYPT